MNKKIIITFLCIIILNTTAFAQSQISKTLTKIENSLFGIEYSNQNDTQRLERIEESIYGEKKSGNIKMRLAKLNEDISTNQMGSEITAKRDTFEEEEENYYSNNSNSKTAQNNQSTSQNEYNYTDEEVADANIEYPIVNDLEKMTYNKEFKNLEIKRRITNLENSILKKTYQNEDLATRVDRLKNKVAYVPAKEQYKYEDKDTFSYYNDDGSSINADDYYYSQNNNYFSPKNTNKNQYNNSDLAYIDKDINDRDFRAKLNKIEKNVFKQSFSDDTIDNRLSRLEGTVFNTTFANDNDVARLNRLSSATKAQKVAKKYDSNAFQQKVATALQIGMFVLMVVAMIL
ncbi:MAG: hypothetical protein ACI4SM_05005 [Candidatus Gastranaerophilaceae bacterium]